MKKRKYTLDDIDEYNFEGCSDCRQGGHPEVVPPGSKVHDASFKKSDVRKVTWVVDYLRPQAGEGDGLYMGVLKDGRHFLVVSGHDYSGHG